MKSLLVPIIIAGASILSFLWGGYVSQATPLYTAIYLVSLGLAIWFSAKLPAKGLIIFAISSFAIAVAVEPTMTAVGLWKYAFSGDLALLYPIFSYSVLLLLMLLLAKVLDEILKRYRERIVSMVLVPIAVAALSIVLMQVEGYLALLSLRAILIYSLLLLLSLYYVIHQPSRWNIALLLSSIITAASMEASGSISGLWMYPFSTVIPLFLPVAWALNVWAVHGLSLILGADLGSSTRRTRLSKILPIPSPQTVNLPAWPTLTLRLIGGWSLASSVGLILGLEPLLSLMGASAVPVKIAIEILLVFTAVLGIGILMASEDPCGNETAIVMGALIMSAEAIFLALQVSSGSLPIFFAGLAVIASAQVIGLLRVYLHVMDSALPPQPELLKRSQTGVKRVLVTYFSLTKQTQRAVEALSEGLKQEGCEVVYAPIETKESIPFPFNFVTLVKTIFQSVSGINVPLKTPAFDLNADYDLIVIGSPTWWTTSNPITRSIFATPEYRQLLKGRNVAVLVVCRALWKSNIQTMKQKILESDAKFVDSIALQHGGQEPYRFISMMLYLWRGKLTGESFFGKQLGTYGLDDNAIEQARLFGVKLGRMLG